MLIVALLVGRVAAAQNDIPVGQWRTHFNYQQSYGVVEVGGKIYSNAFHSLLELDQATRTIQKLTKANALSDAGITAMAGDEKSGSLIVGYTSGNIDVLRGTTTINVDALKKANLTTSRRINCIFIAGNSFFVGTAFGMLEIDINNLGVVNTFEELGRNGSPLSVLDGGVKGDSIWLATSRGLLAANYRSGLNLLDFRNWKRTLEGAGQIDFFEASEQASYAGTRGGRLWRNTGPGWSELPALVPTNFLVVDGGDAYYGTGNQLHKRSLSDEVIQITLGISTNVQQVLPGADGIWVADQANGLGYRTAQGISFYTLDGPAEKTIYTVKAFGDIVWTLGGGYESNGLIPFGRPVSVSSFSRQGWQRLDVDLAGSFADASDAAFADEEVFIILYGRGIYKTSTSELIDHTTAGSLLTASDGFVAPTALFLSPDGDLVISANQPAGRYMVRKADGTWERLDFIPADLPPAISIVRNAYGDYWAALPHSLGGGVLVFNPEAKTYRQITAASGLPSSTVYHISFDRDDYAWLATAGGVAVIANTYEVFDPVDLLVSSPVAENNFVLKDLVAYTIATDGANRKWVGTDKGLFLLDEFGAGSLTTYNTDNTALPVNEVRQVAINGQSGEVFALTSAGLVSFRSGATAPAKVMQSARIFPNPVRPGYSGLVAIDGLAFDTVVKITDEAGRLVREMVSTGGTATWNLLDLHGSRVSSGIYLIFAASRDGSQALVGKLAVIN